MVPMPNLPPTGRPGIPKRSNLRWSDLDDGDEVLCGKNTAGLVGWVGWVEIHFLGGEKGVGGLRFLPNMTWRDGFLFEEKTS